jgi:signal transduction histidine kinase
MVSMEYQEHLPLIFERFYGVDKARWGIEIGLAIVKHIVQAHRRAHTCRESAPGKRSTFSMIFPARVSS